MINLDADTIRHYRRSLWGQATRGLFGIIRILQHYEAGDLQDAPSQDYRLAAKQLTALADTIEAKGHDDNTVSFSTPHGAAKPTP